MFKTVALPEDTWVGIDDALAASTHPDAARFAAMLKEQIGGDVKVRVTRTTVKMKAKAGVDLRKALATK